ncbi:hypothetical protein [Gordonia liuliyuniae]|uniref:DUF3558 domain-containing protein n=1 Tax=Gordonia liuliyuniae TaxID=2911517 RepID=A0ABS9IPI4_9ACTN|nr:hypothetical protein [Gordonia liuliyuniae]MCF8587452.1 hypothetical protein [Gordonia liuliyuniae]
MKSSSTRTTWVLASLAVALLVAVAVVVALIVSDRIGFTDGDADVTETVVTVTSAVSPPSAPTTTESPATTTEYVAPEPAGSTPVQGGPCFEAEVRSFATSADGQNLVCTYMGTGGGYVWVSHAENDGSVHDIGDPCDSSVDRVAQDPSGQAIMCGGDTWVGGP